MQSVTTARVVDCTTRVHGSARTLATK